MVYGGDENDRFLRATNPKTQTPNPDDVGRGPWAEKQTAQDAIATMIRAKAVLAPMAGITDIPFRMLARKFGCKFAFTEMVDINGIFYKNRKSLSLIKRFPGDDPLGVQLAGEDADRFLEVAKLCEDMGFSVIDINAGCPARKVIKGGKGSALLKDVKKLAEIIKKVKSGVSIPVTIKIRSGWDELNLNYIEVAKMAEAEGAGAICIHPRTTEKMFKGKIDHSIIGEIKRSVKIPVFASGNIFTSSDAKDLLDQNICDGVFVARGAFGHPWIFREINELLSKGEVTFWVEFEEIKKIMLEHFKLCLGFYNEVLARKRMYKHVSWYLKGYKNLNEIMEEYLKVQNLEDFQRFLDRIYLEGNRLIVL
ncbi:MAG: tRNA dihydrouridine synthase DusB [Candidatus Omnitrophica bacterium]|nr:tRNA dihydrouridine synthase DusB [Candidatus Omnitrophota bacterium]